MNNFKNKNKNTISILLHVLVWGVLFSVPYLLSIDSPNGMSRMIGSNGIRLVLFGALFYLNYFFLIDKFYFPKKNILFISINILLIILVTGLWFQFKDFFHGEKPPMDLSNNGDNKPLNRPPFGMFLYLDSLSFIVPVIFSLALKVTGKWRENEILNQEVENVKLESELKYLKHQLQPHFFFNTINNIYSLIDVSSEDAKTSLHKLGKLMRYLLYNTSEKNALLQDELNFLENYIELMKLRYSDNVVVSVDFPEVDPTIQIPPLLFISLIENSFKHGVDAIKPSSVKVVLKVDNNHLKFMCINSYYDNHSEDKTDKGIGVNNLKRRMELLFPNNYTLINEKRGGEYYSELIIPRKND